MVDMVAAIKPGAPLVHDEWGDNVFSRRSSTTISRDPRDAPRSRCDGACAPRASACRRSKGAAWWRCDRRLDQLDGPLGGADAAHQPRRALRVPRHRPGRIRVDRARRRRRLRLQGHPAARGGLPRLARAAARAAGALARGPARAAHRERQLPRARLRHHRSTPTPTAGCSRSTAKPRSIRAPTRPIRSPPASRRRRSGSILPGPYKMDRYRCRTWSVGDQQAADPAVPRRRAHRRVLRARAHRSTRRARGSEGAARGAPREPRPAGGDAVREHHQEAFRLRRLPGGAAARGRRRSTSRGGATRQRRGEPDGRRIGVGLRDLLRAGRARHLASITAGASRWCPGTSNARARLSPDGMLELRIGAHSHGQGMETTLAQVAHEILGVDPDNVRLVHGDTALTPYSTGTWGSRCMVMSGGAVATACKEIGERVTRHRRASCWKWPAATWCSMRAGCASPARDRSVTLAEVAHVWYRAPQLLPADVDPAGLEATAGYKAAKRHRHVQLRLPRRARSRSTPSPARSRSSTTSSSRTAARW